MSVCCPDSVRIFYPVSACPDLSRFCPVSGFCPGSLSGRIRARQSCPDFRCPCPPTSALNQITSRFIIPDGLLYSSDRPLPIAWLTIYFCLSSAFNILNLKYDRPLLDWYKRWSQPINVTQYNMELIGHTGSLGESILGRKNTEIKVRYSMKRRVDWWLSIPWRWFREDFNYGQIIENCTFSVIQNMWHLFRQILSQIKQKLHPYTVKVIPDSSLTWTKQRDEMNGPSTPDEDFVNHNRPL